MYVNLPIIDYLIEIIGYDFFYGISVYTNVQNISLKNKNSIINWKLYLKLKNYNVWFISNSLHCILICFNGQYIR